MIHLLKLTFTPTFQASFYKYNWIFLNQKASKTSRIGLSLSSFIREFNSLFQYLIRFVYFFSNCTFKLNYKNKKNSCFDFSSKINIIFDPYIVNFHTVVFTFNDYLKFETSY